MLCCNKEIKNVNVIFLKDIKNFTGRKMFTAECPYCGTLNLILCEKRTQDNKVFCDIHKGKSAVKVYAREFKRIAVMLPVLAGVSEDWIYGHNIQIKNKQGKVVQIRQYAKSLTTGISHLIKKIQY